MKGKQSPQKNNQNATQTSGQKKTTDDYEQNEVYKPTFRPGLDEKTGNNPVHRQNWFTHEQH